MDPKECQIWQSKRLRLPHRAAFSNIALDRFKNVIWCKWGGGPRSECGVWSGAHYILGSSTSKQRHLSLPSLFDSTSSQIHYLVSNSDYTTGLSSNHGHRKTQFHSQSSQPRQVGTLHYVSRALGPVIAITGQC